jgi:hypothetical protein
MKTNTTPISPNVHLPSLVSMEEMDEFFLNNKKDFHPNVHLPSLVSMEEMDEFFLNNKTQLNTYQEATA